MERILIIGSNGAGKSTFSYALAEKTGLPLIHIDRLYWRGEWEVTPQDEFEATVLAEAQKPRWIIEGNNIRSLHQRLPYADAVFWFEFPPIVCLLGILRREWAHRGQSRPDMPPGCKSRLSLSFLRAAAGFNRKHGPVIRALLSDAPHVRVIRFVSHRQAAQWLRDEGTRTGDDGERRWEAAFLRKAPPKPSRKAHRGQDMNRQG